MRTTSAAALSSNIQFNEAVAAEYKFLGEYFIEIYHLFELQRCVMCLKKNPNCICLPQISLSDVSNFDENEQEHVDFLLM